LHGGGERSVSIVVEFHTRTRDEPFVDTAYKLGYDILVAVNRASANPAVADQPSLRLGGLVSGLSLVSMIPAIGEGQAPWCGVIVTLSVSFTLKDDDLFTIVT
jgi:hypothetical protein